MKRLLAAVFAITVLSALIILVDGCAKNGNDGTIYTGRYLRVGSQFADWIEVRKDGTCRVLSVTYFGKRIIEGQWSLNDRKLVILPLETHQSNIRDFDSVWSFPSEIVCEIGVDHFSVPCLTVGSQVYVLRTKMEVNDEGEVASILNDTEIEKKRIDYTSWYKKTIELGPQASILRRMAIGQWASPSQPHCDILDGKFNYSPEQAQRVKYIMESQKLRQDRVEVNYRPMLRDQLFQKACDDYIDIVRLMGPEQKRLFYQEVQPAVAAGLAEEKATAEGFRAFEEHFNKIYEQMNAWEGQAKAATKDVFRANFSYLLEALEIARVSVGRRDDGTISPYNLFFSEAKFDTPVGYICHPDWNRLMRNLPGIPVIPDTKRNYDYYLDVLYVFTYLIARQEDAKYYDRHVDLSGSVIKDVTNDGKTVEVKVECMDADWRQAYPIKAGRVFSFICPNGDELKLQYKKVHVKFPAYFVPATEKDCLTIALADEPSVAKP